MLNVGPDGQGIVPGRAASSLRDAGEWIHRYPQVVYGTDASPWGRAMPWGDVTVKKNRLFLSVFDWPESGKLFLPGLKTKIQSVRLLSESDSKAIPFEKDRNWTVMQLPARAPETLASVIEIKLAGAPEVDSCFGLDPNVETEIRAQFSAVESAEISKDRWMEKFGEWKCEYPATKWESGGKAIWEDNVLVPGDYDVALTYTGEGRLVWGVDIVDGEHIQNQQNASHNYQQFPIGQLNFPKRGKYKVAVSCLDGNIQSAKLRSIHLLPLGTYGKSSTVASIERQ